MNRFFLLLIALLTTSVMYAQLEPPQKPQYKRSATKSSSSVHGRFGVGVGACLHPYQYPITDLSCRVVVLKAKYVVDGRLRAYGIKSLVNGRNYDALAYLHKIKAWKTNITRYWGVGAAATFRGGDYAELPGNNDVQAMFLCGSMYYKKKFYCNVPLWAKVGLDGFDVSVLPEPSYKLGDDAQVFLRYELSFHSDYALSESQLRHDVMLGSYFYF